MFWTGTIETALGQVSIDHRHAKELGKYLTKDRKREYPYPIPWRGPKLIRFEVYRVPINVLRFNFGNTRIRAELEGIMHDIGGEIDPEDPAQQMRVETILLESKNIGEMETRKLKEDLQRRGQLDPVVSTIDGVLIDGNRRLAIFRSLDRDALSDREFSEMDTCVLPADANTNDLKELEMRIQMSHDFRVPYVNMNAALEFRDLHRNLGWALERIEELTLNQFKKSVIEDMIEIIDLIDEYLGSIPPKGKYTKRYTSLSKGWESFHNLHYTLSYWKRREISSEQLDRLKLFGFEIIHHQKSTYSDVRAFNHILKDTNSFEKLKEDSETLKGHKLASFLDPARVEREYENLQAAKEVLKESQEDPKKALKLALRRILKIKASRVNANDRELIVLLKQLKLRILELEKRLGQ